MFRKISYEDCIDFIENVKRVKLYDYQKIMIKCFCEGLEIRVPRGCGRTLCATLFGEYISYVYDKNLYYDQPDVVISTEAVKKAGQFDEEFIKILSYDAKTEQQKKFNDIQFPTFPVLEREE